MTLVLDETIWKPRIVASAAATQDRFIIVLRQSGFDDEFSVMLEYDGNFQQPWSRIEADGGVEDVTYGVIEGEDNPVAFALTNEGEVFTLIPSAVQSDKITGVGLNVEDADGRGQTFDIARSGMTTFVAGAGKQLYRKTADGEWRTISADNTIAGGYLEENFGTLTALSDGRIIFDSHQRPGTYAQVSLMEDPRYREDMTADEIVALMASRREEGPGGPPITRLYQIENDVIAQVEIPTNVFIREIKEGPGGKIWIIGVDGLIMHGTLEDGFSRLDFHGDTETLLSIAWRSGEPILAGSIGLYQFDGHMLHRIRPLLDPKINNGIPVPQAIYGFEEFILYVDAKHGVSTWDGHTWQTFVIPTTLLARKLDPSAIIGKQ